MSDHQGSFTRPATPLEERGWRNQEHSQRKEAEAAQAAAQLQQQEQRNQRRHRRRRAAAMSFAATGTAGAIISGFTDLSDLLQ